MRAIRIILEWEVLGQNNFHASDAILSIENSLLESAES